MNISRLLTSALATLTIALTPQPEVKAQEFGIYQPQTNTDITLNSQETRAHQRETVRIRLTRIQWKLNNDQSITEDEQYFLSVVTLALFEIWDRATYNPHLLTPSNIAFADMVESVLGEWAYMDLYYNIYLAGN